jgi:hypothetical protein
MTKSRGVNKPKFKFSVVDEILIREDFPDTKTDVLAQVIGCTVGQLHGKAKRMGVKKSEAYLAGPDACRLRRGDNIGAPHRFKPGHQTWSKGTKGIVGVQEGCRATPFKKGRPAQESSNYVPIGTEKVDKDGYLVRKVTDDPKLFPARRWVGVHRLVWEAANGPIPEGHCIGFLPGRKSVELELITVDALECITFAERMRRNTIHNQHPEIAGVARLRGRIKRAINKRAQHEQDDQRSA